VRGITRGMLVEWSMERALGGTLVRIDHDFDPPWPRPLGPLVARYVVGDVFVHDMANKTLRCIKSLAEGAVSSAVASGDESDQAPGTSDGRHADARGSR
jgi:hypothetical protein